MNLREQIRKDIEDKVSGMVGQWDGRVEVTRASDARFGDYTSNVAMIFARQFKQSPMDFAKKLADSLKDQAYIEKLEVKEPGFLNFFIKDKIWQKEVGDVLKTKDKFESEFSGKKVVVEFTDPNPFKQFHVGHLYSNSVGESISRLLEAVG